MTHLTLLTLRTKSIVGTVVQYAVATGIFTSALALGSIVAVSFFFTCDRYHPHWLIRSSVLPETGWVLFHCAYIIIVESGSPSISPAHRLCISVSAECTPMPFWLRKCMPEIVIVSLILLIDSMLAGKCGWLSNLVKPAPVTERQELGLFKVGIRRGVAISRLSR